MVSNDHHSHLDEQGGPISFSESAGSPSTETSGRLLGLGGSLKRCVVKSCSNICRRCLASFFQCLLYVVLHFCRISMFCICVSIWGLWPLFVPTSTAYALREARIAMNDFGLLATLQWHVPLELGGGPLSHEAGSGAQ